MANLPGTNITAPVRPYTDQDPIPTFHANEGLGGHHSTVSVALRDAILPERRAIGMTCFVEETGLTYQLVGGVLNQHWRDSVRPALPLYTGDAEADTDDALPPGALYRLAGRGRAVFVKLPETALPMSVTIGDYALTIGDYPLTIG